MGTKFVQHVCQLSTSWTAHSGELLGFPPALNMDESHRWPRLRLYQISSAVWLPRLAASGGSTGVPTLSHACHQQSRQQVFEESLRTAESLLSHLLSRAEERGTLLPPHDQERQKARRCAPEGSRLFR